MIYSPPIIQPIPSQGLWLLYEDWWREMPYAKSILHIKKGFIFDGASIPRSCWTLTGFTPSDPRIISEALGHDGLYAGHMFGEGPHGRLACDREFLSLMQLGHPDLRKLASVFYDAVRIGGESAFNNHAGHTQEMRKLVTFW